MPNNLDQISTLLSELGMQVDQSIERLNRINAHWNRAKNNKTVVLDRAPARAFERTVNGELAVRLGDCIYTIRTLENYLKFLLDDVDRKVV